MVGAQAAPQVEQKRAVDSSWLPQEEQNIASSGEVYFVTVCCTGGWGSWFPWGAEQATAKADSSASLRNDKPMQKRNTGVPRLRRAMKLHVSARNDGLFWRSAKFVDFVDRIDFHVYTWKYLFQ